MHAKITSFVMAALCWCPLVLLADTDNAADAVFHIECPDDVTVACDAEIWDLSAYGWAYVYGYGSPVPANNPVVAYHLNTCGSGYVTRTWTAYDYQNNPFSCTQYIYVGGGGFDVHNIHWPPNYMTSDCYADLDPDDLPAPFDYPTYDAVDCSMIMIGYNDLVFDFGGGCKKILRTWSLLDWCTHDPNHPSSGGRWDYTQILKVKPGDGLTLTCPDDVMANAGPNCSGTYVSIPPASGIGACGGSVQVTNNSPYASSGGADASGLYPYGTTWVTFTAEDACGNWESCKIKVVVKDMKKPTPICYNGLTANLMMNSDGYYIDLDPKWFNKGSFDNCTPKHLLTYRLEPSRFTCDERGRQDVRMYVKDQDGNEQYCNTYVIIQDNMGMCPPIDTSSFTLSGQLLNIQGAALGGMDLELMQNGDLLNESVSNSSGMFEFNVLNSEDYMIIPRGDQAYTLGLSTFDLLKLAKHINGVKPLVIDAELVAADADQNGQVDVQDLLLLRMLLLNYTNKLPNNKAWRFIPTDLLNANPTDPMSMTFNEYWQKNNLYENVDDIDFTAIKIGDINGSVQGINGATERSTALKIELQAIQHGDRIDFVSQQFLDVSGCQMELNIGSEKIEGIEGGKINISLAHAKLSNKNTLMSWYLPEGSVSINQGDILFSLSLESDQPVDFSLVQRTLAAEVYSANELVYNINLSHGQKIEVEQDVLMEGVLIFPNPVKSNQEIQIVSTDSKIAEITLFNSQGQLARIIHSVDGADAKISTASFQSGLYLVQVKTIDGKVKLEKIVIE